MRVAIAFLACVGLCFAGQTEAFSPSPSQELSGTGSKTPSFVGPLPFLSTRSSSTKTTITTLNFFGRDNDNGIFSFPHADGAAVLAACLAVIISSFQVVNTGEIGIVNQLGSLSKLESGPHLVAPFISSVSFLSTKTQLLEQSNFVPTKEGLTVELDTAILYRLNKDQGLDVFGSVGRDYSSKILEPEASSAVRGLTSEAEAKALYTSGRSAIQNRLKGDLAESLGPRGIIIEDVLLKAVKLPEDLSKSIELKAKAEQESARMEFVLAKEKQEAERKAIEAQGIAEFQRIVSKGITPDLLQWKGIEAMTKLANSENSKIVVIGNGKNSLPVILGDSNK